MADSQNKNNKTKAINEITWEDCRMYLDNRDNELSILIPEPMKELLDQYRNAWRKGKQWAIQDMLNRRFGTPTQRMDMTTKGEKVEAGIFVPKDLKDK